ncbi:hypothetical protein OQA88_9452 [Cercophora sp. LCS_1]
MAITAYPNRTRKRAGREFSVDSCPLCHLIGHTFGNPAGELRGNDYQLYSYSSGRIKSGGWAAIDTVMLSLQDKTRFHERDFSTEMRFLVPQVRADKPIRIIPPLVSTPLLREWVARCREGHDKFCGLAADAMAPLSEMSSFRTIGCRTGKLPYATLSYVWGGEPAPLYAAALDIPQLPPTIQDTIALTLALGIGHLWIDRYCIDQQSDAEKAEQLPKIDLIYNLSEVTIINADGEGTKLGLAGMMGQPRRTRQPQTRIGTRLLASTPRHPSFDIRTSIWWSRGWTYQEGLLARRRLVFTQGQAYYERGGMYCCEALNFDLDALHTLDGRRFKAQYKLTDRLALFKPAGLGGSAWDVTRRIQEYSERALREEDVLDGIRGVLGAMEKGRWRLRHLWGVPVLLRGPRPTGIRSKEIDEYREAYDSITWTPTVGLCAGLCWRSDSRLEKRAGFPSWSWTGWKLSAQRRVVELEAALEASAGAGQWAVPVGWLLEESEWRLFQGSQSLKVHVEVEQGRLDLDDTEFQRHYERVGGRLPVVLDMSAWVTPIPIISWKGLRGVTAEVEGAEGGHRLKWEFYGTTTTRHLAEVLTYATIELGRDVGNSSTPSVYVLVVVEVGEGVYERAGIGKWDRMTLWDPLKPNTIVIDGKEIPCLLKFGLGPPAVAKVWKEFQLR